MFGTSLDDLRQRPSRPCRHGLTLIALEIGLRLWEGYRSLCAYNFVGLELDKLHKPGTGGGLAMTHLGSVNSPNVVMNADFPETRVTTGEFCAHAERSGLETLNIRPLLSCALCHDAA